LIISGILALLLIAPEGIEIWNFAVAIFFLIVLLIAPEGIEMNLKVFCKNYIETLNRTRKN